MKTGFIFGLVIGFLLLSIQVPLARAQENGATLLEQRCSVCHPSAIPKSKQKTPEQWDATVTRMMGHGAKLTPEEKQILVDYLSKTYKP